MPFVLCGFETWSVTLMGEQRPTAFENRVLRKIFGPKRDEGTGEWRRIQNEEPCDLYSSPADIPVLKARRKRCGGRVKGTSFGTY